jgi:hypothetical protein
MGVLAITPCSGDLFTRGAVFVQMLEVSGGDVAVGRAR